MKRGIILSLFLCSLLWGQWQLPPSQKPMLGMQLDWSGPINRGRVGYWLMNEGTGDIVNNLVGSSAPLVKGSLGVWSACPVGSCLSRTGTAQTLAVGSAGPSLAFSNTSDFSIVFYGLVGAHSVTSFAITADASIASMDINFYYYSSGGTDRLYFYTVGSSSVYTRWDTVTPNVVGPVLHVVGVYQGATQTRTLYVNGQVKNTGSSDPGTKTSTGLVTFINSNGWAGYAMVYNRALSASEVSLLYSEPFAGFYTDPFDLWQAALLDGGTTIPVFMHHYQTLNLN